MQLSNFPTPLPEDSVFSPLYVLASFDEDKLTVSVRVYFWAFYSLPLIHISVFVPVPCFFDYCGFAVLSEVWESYASYFVLFLQYYFSNPESFMVPYEF